MDIIVKPNFSRPFSAFSTVDDIIQQAKKSRTKQLTFDLKG